MTALSPSRSSHGLRSLWDMLRLHAENFSKLSAWLGQMHVIYTTKRPIGGNPPAKNMHDMFDEQALLYLINECKKAVIYCDKFGFSGASKTLELIAKDTGTFNSVTRNMNVP